MSKETTTSTLKAGTDRDKNREHIMKTIIITTAESAVVKIANADQISSEALNARIRRAEKKVGKLYGHSFGDTFVFVSLSGHLKHAHRWALSSRAGAYQPERFGKKVFSRGIQHGRGAKMAGQWLIKKAVSLGYSDSCLPQARILRERGVPSIAYRLASGEASLLGPVTKLP